MCKSFGRILWVLALLVPCTLEAQTGTLRGTVLDVQTGSPLGGVEIQVLPSGSGTLSNQEGRFSLSLPPGTYAVVATMISYAAERRNDVRIDAGATTTLTVEMTPQALQLDQLVITISRGLPELASQAPNMVDVVTREEIAARPTTTPADLLRGSPGVDIATGGIQSSNVVVRGFNNAFSGALHFLTDHRLAGIPSLRVNLLHFIPSNNEDIERMEVVLGPASALYGPNTTNGVLHLLTKSPLDTQETVVTAAGGERSVFQGTFRTSHLLTEDFGVKLSGQLMRGDEWEYVDPVEAAARAAIMSNPDSVRAVMAATGVPADEIGLRMERIGVRDFDTRRWGLEARADWRLREDATAVFQAGMTDADGIELTGIGAGQTESWRYGYYQARLNWDRLFAQAYLNTSDAGDSFLLRQGAPLIDNSKMWVAQVQHGFSLADTVQDFTYGVDYFHTDPRTEGTIHGQYEDEDEIDEIGAFLQSRTLLGDHLELVLALRADDNSALDDLVWSPRAGLILKPAEGHSFRATYNRAFSTPTTLNMFLDINGGPAAGGLGSLGFFLRATGPGTEGLQFMEGGNLLGMRSPFTPAGLGGPGQLLPADVSTLYQLGLGLLLAQGAIDQPTFDYLSGFTPTSEQIGMNLFDPSPNSFSVQPLDQATIPDTPPLKESITTTYEAGYNGLFGDWLSVGTGVWYSERTNFTSPLVLRTPLLTMDQADLTGFFEGAGLSPEQAAALGGALGSTPNSSDVGVPLAVASSSDVTTTGADMIASYINFGKVELWGVDLNGKALLNETWTLGGMASWVSDDHFDVGGQLVALNAPRFKSAVSLGYESVVSGVNGEVRVRHTDGFPVNSADFVGTACIGGEGPLVQPCVDSFTLVDLLLGYRIPRVPVSLQLAVSNLFDEDYRSFVGVPAVGRMALLRMKWDVR